MYQEFNENNLQDGFNNINFDVEIAPLYYMDPTRTLIIDTDDWIKTNQIAIVKKHNAKLLSIQSENYKLLKNSDIISKLDPFFNQGYHINKVSNYDDKKFRFELINNDINFDVNNHTMHPRMVVENSYDGTLSFKAMAGYYVQVCSNGAMVGSKFYSINSKHIGKTFISDFNSFDGDKVADMLNDFTLKQWIKKLEPEDVINIKDVICRGIPDRINDQPSYTKIQLENRYLKEKEAISGQDEFAMFMAATNLATHGNKYGIPYNYMRSMERNISELFVNNFKN